jgi:hypothetical protein
MMSTTLGLSLREDRVDGAVVRWGPAGPRLTHHFVLETDEDLAGALRAKLAELGVKPRRVHVGLPRRLAVVKTIELPNVAGADLRRMVGFELERHLPFAPGDALFGFEVLERAPGRPARVLLVAAERRVFERVRQLAREIGAEPRLVDVAVHAVALVLSRGRRREERGGQAVVRVLEHEAEIALARGGRLLGSRAVPLPADPGERARALAQEVRRTLAALPAADRETVADLTVLGPVPPGLDLREVAVHADLAEPLASAPPGAAVALALALRRVPKGTAGPNLLPEELRPRPFPWPAALTAALCGVTLLLAAAIPLVTVVRAERTLAGLEATIAQLGPDVRRVEQLVAQVERARREAETLRSFDAQGVPALPVLRELTEILPADAWLTSLTADRNGVELVGYATGASQLIPLLEGLPRLERAEFTSPVTRGGDKEQFRLRAAWEVAAAPAGAAAAPDAVGRGGGPAGAGGPVRAAPPAAPPPPARRTP